MVALPRGISRHVVRFIRVGDEVYAAKEVVEHLALHEYRLLHDLMRLNTPAVEPVGVVSQRVDADGRPLDPILITKHLQFSLPYRTLFSKGVRSDTVTRLLDAMVVLLARLHLIGFLWGDVSLSNTLFRRDASDFAAHLVDAETGEFHDRLSKGQREHDLEMARVNLFGEFLDLEAGGMLDSALDPGQLVETIVTRYHELWHELTGAEEFDGSQMHRIEGRVRRLNALGFDVAELDITTDIDGSTIRIQPKVVDAGHHARRLMRLTGLDTEENQARRLLNDLDSYRARTGQQNLDESVVAHQWLTECFEPVLAAVPAEYAAKLEPAQVYHEMLDYRWYRSEAAGHEIPLLEATQGYVRDVLSTLPDEQLSVGRTHGPGQSRDVTTAITAEDLDDDTVPDDPWETAHTGDEDALPQGYLDMAAIRARAARRTTSP